MEVSKNGRNTEKYTSNFDYPSANSSNLYALTVWVQCTEKETGK